MSIDVGLSSSSAGTVSVTHAGTEVTITVDHPRTFLVLGLDPATNEGGFVKVDASPGTTTCHAPLMRAGVLVEVVDAGTGDVHARFDLTA